MDSRASYRGNGTCRCRIQYKSLTPRESSSLWERLPGYCLLFCLHFFFIHSTARLWGIFIYAGRVSIGLFGDWSASEFQLILSQIDVLSYKAYFSAPAHYLLPKRRSATQGPHRIVFGEPLSRLSMQRLFVRKLTCLNEHSSTRSNLPRKSF
ncbi:hypothetical protein F5B17DRAFT_62126 [Nemania serpens]|nr:hypothetical protein F5B17DRAFT_62126 [Nemania serpens]